MRQAPAKRAYFLLALLAICASGCAAFPEVMHQPEIHNPFPQLHRVAVLPFYNQSNEPTVDGEQVAIEYYTALQKVPGFEVMPVPVAMQWLREQQISPQKAEDMQWIARQLGVDAVIAGSITEYTAYYPPRLGLAVNWYAANPGFHPIPAGYGLPWGTGEEEFIPNNIKREAEFELAREQLKTQTPRMPDDSEYQPTRETAPVAPPPKKSSEKFSPENDADDGSRVVLAKHSRASNAGAAIAGDSTGGNEISFSDEFEEGVALPEDWPDPRGFTPAPPSPTRPDSLPSREPIITHTRLYDATNSDVTQAAQSYYMLMDDGRLGGWQTMLHRSSDYIKFCCSLHVYETLAARGGADESRLLLRWPLGR
jgi:hypothetical protein